MTRAKHTSTSSSRGGRDDKDASLAQPSGEELRRMIAENAYHRARRRGFAGGDPVRDWLEAEREIRGMIPSARRQRDELAAYRKMRELLGDRLIEIREGLNAAALREALERARFRLREAGQHTADTVDRAAAAIEKEVAHTFHRLGPRWERFSEKSAGLFDVWRDRGSVFLSHAATAAGEWLREAGARLEHPSYRTGEMTAAGTFECTACGQRVELETPAHLPPCPSCLMTEFRRV